MSVIQLMGPALGLAYLSGINLYAAVLTIGLGNRFGFIELPEQLQALTFLSEPTVLVIAGILFAIEFIADKIPWVDSIWDSIHIMIRPVGASVIGVIAIGDIDPIYQNMAYILFGGVGLSSHTSKASARLVTNQSPEPFSNIFLSLLEDGVVVAGAWMVTAYPILSFWIVVVLLVLTAFIMPKMIRLIRLEISAFVAIIKSALRSINIIKSKSLVSGLPDKYDKLIPSEYMRTENDIFLLLFTRKGVMIGGKKLGRNHKGYLSIIDGHLLILIKKRFKIREYRIDENEFTQSEFRSGLILDRLSLRYKSRVETFHIPKGQADWTNKVIENIHETLST